MRFIELYKNLRLMVQIKWAWLCNVWKISAVQTCLREIVLLGYKIKFAKGKNEHILKVLFIWLEGNATRDRVYKRKSYRLDSSHITPRF